MAGFDLATELKSVLGVLNQSGIDYAICGGVAVAIHGHVRATKDIDVLVMPEAADNLLTHLESIGYTLRARPMEFGSGVTVHRVSRVEDGELFTVDLIMSNPGLARAWANRQQGSWNGMPLWVVSREGLAHMKRLAGRAQDLADLEALHLDIEEHTADD